MREQLPALIVITPLVVALLSPLLAYFSRKLLRGFSLLALAVSFFSAVGVLKQVLETGPWHYAFGNWAPPWGIEYVIDPLSGFLATLIATLSFWVLVYAAEFFKAEKWYKEGGGYGLHLLATAGLLGMSVSGDVFNLYVFFEISSLATYGLIALGGRQAVVAAFKYLVLGTMGISFYLLGVGYLYALTGTLNMQDLAVRIQPVLNSSGVMIALALMTIGLLLKMAQFPLHGWLPDAHTFAPAPLSALMSGIVIKAPAYVLFRIYFGIIGSGAQAVSKLLMILGIIAALGMIAGSLMAIAQSELKRMLAYSSVAQIGYVVLGISLGNSYGFIGALLHMVNHAFMKGCLFFVAGAFIYKTGEYSLDKLKGMYKQMPLAMGSFSLAAFSMIGIPPLAGFFSKWYLALGAIKANLWPYVLVIIISSLLNLIYFFRVIENVYMSGEGAVVKRSKGLELPLSMLIPIVVLGVGVLVLGLTNEQIVTRVLQNALLGGGF
ncbi:MAG TPA: monovalent cation/H+ antiporter subunit D family protein [Clostridia bacterium]|jgi:multicomponent Na+:H+ antiporter subunit D|nr:monovalent cation/H+ antiporter subunit D family protein [Clostridia bacterium]